MWSVPYCSYRTVLCISFGCGPIINDCHKAGNKERC
ncbi:hypothetical protein H206_05510 [Candidatus Electrothrix aarhusensis]|uniref:Uncharacterized protein n=1 Tax=Candidatus Electrothrix aarhusensis TaxID=1859131 RepID=A0A3S3RA78_9BACT|nr:hypothetical protein H206_05510 [Candidatus Electrothrix aarhusensis]